MLGNSHVTPQSSICAKMALLQHPALIQLLIEWCWAYVRVTVLWDPLDIRCLLLGVISGWNVNVVWDEKEGSLHTVWCFHRCVPCTLDSRHAFVAATWTWEAFFSTNVCSCFPALLPSCLANGKDVASYCFDSPQMLSVIKESEMEKWMWGTQISTTGSWSNTTPFYL